MSRHRATFVRLSWRARVAAWWVRNVIGTAPSEYARLDLMDGLGIGESGADEYAHFPPETNRKER